MKQIEKIKMIGLALIATVLLVGVAMFVVNSRQESLINAIAACDSFSETCMTGFGGTQLNPATGRFEAGASTYIEGCVTKTECIDMVRAGQNPY
jgi:hypothetical protein